MDNDTHPKDSLDEIVSFVSMDQRKREGGERKSQRQNTQPVWLGIWTLQGNNSTHGTHAPMRQYSSRYAGCLVIIVGMFALSIALAMTTPLALAVESTYPAPPKPPSVVDGIFNPFQPGVQAPIPFEQPTVDGDDGDVHVGTVIQPQLSLTQNYQPVLSSIAIPNVMVLIIGLAVVEKIKVRKKVRMKIVSGA